MAEGTQGNTGDVYGGADWRALELQQMLALLSNSEFLQQLLGYVETGGTPGTPAPTSDQALRAIWDNRPDIQEVYQREWGKNVDPMRAMRDWISTTPEFQGSTNRAQSALDFALERGWVQPASEGTPGEKTKTMPREAMEAGQAMDYLNLMASMRGPQDWLTYANVQRAAEGAPQPAWAKALLDNVALPSYQGAATPQGLLAPSTYQPTVDPNQYAYTNNAPQVAQGELDVGYILGAPNPYPNAPVPSGQRFPPQGGGGEGIQLGPVQPPTAPQPRTGQYQYQGPATWMQQLAGLQGNQVNPQVWRNMLPSEQAMVAGAIEGQGGWMEDWLTKMARAAPTGQATGTSWFEGW